MLRGQRTQGVASVAAGASDAEMAPIGDLTEIVGRAADALNVSPAVVVIALAIVALVLIGLTITRPWRRRLVEAPTEISAPPSPRKLHKRAAALAPVKFVAARIVRDDGGEATEIVRSALNALTDRPNDVVMLSAPVTGEIETADAEARRDASRRKACAVLWGVREDDRLELRAAPAGDALNDPAAAAAAELIVIPMSNAVLATCAIAAAAAAVGRCAEPARQSYLEKVLAPAVADLKAALERPGDEDAPLSRLDAARFQHVLGLASMRLYDETGDADDLDVAVEAARLGAWEGRRSASVHEWAAGEALLGRAVAARAARAASPGDMNEAARAFRNALSGSDGARTAIAKARLELAFAEALIGAAAADPSTRGVEDAYAALDRAAPAFHSARDTDAAARARLAQARALSVVGHKMAGLGRLEDAERAYSSWIKSCDRKRAPQAWASAQHERAGVLRELGRRERGVERLREAGSAYEQALSVRSRVDHPLQWAASQRGLGVVLETIGEREKGAASLASAVAALRASLQAYEDAGAPDAAARVRQDLSRAERLLAERRARADAA